jgi:hypothetical protein
LIFENWLVTYRDEAYLLGALKHVKDIREAGFKSVPKNLTGEFDSGSE